MKKDPKVLLTHILESIDLISQYIQGISHEQFLRSIEKQDAVLRRIEIIGEAARNLPDEIKTSYPDIAWRDIIAMRNILIHKYFGIDLNLTWKVARERMPKLKEEISKILKLL